jgi:hypothetical protein
MMLLTVVHSPAIAAPIGDPFWATGRAVFAFPATDAEKDMRENAQAVCGRISVAKQLTQTVFQTFPKSYPTETRACAQFVCESLTPAPSF